MYGYHNFVVTTPSNHQMNFIKMSTDVSKEDTVELAHFMHRCLSEAADAYVLFCPEDMSLEDWYENTTVQYIGFTALED